MLKRSNAASLRLMKDDLQIEDLPFRGEISTTVQHEPLYGVNKFKKRKQPSKIL